MYHCGMMRQVEERHAAARVELMAWSHRLDLLALSNFKGEVQVHRLNWQKVCNLGPPTENDLVRALAWRPDGKALAIGYSSGCVCIMDIEDKEILNKFHLESRSGPEFEDQPALGVTCLAWPVRAGILGNATEYNIYDDASIFLPKLPPANSFKNQGTEENGKDYKEVVEQTQLNVLLVGYGAGYVHMSIFGRYAFGTIDISRLVHEHDECGEYKVLDVQFTDDFSVLQVLYSDRASNAVYAALINTSVLSAYAGDVFTVANRHEQVSRVMSLLQQTMCSVGEAWEHMLLEMDTKMAVYAAAVPEGGVAADFLELLMMGVPSDDLEVFLLQDLTAKGLKKFGSSVELSYSTIQKLVLKQLNLVGQSLTYYLAELKGLTNIPDRYKMMGIEAAAVRSATRACFAFLNKCLELQQVIDVSMRNYKSFFRWLFVVIVRLLDEQTPSEIVKITQQELAHIAEFLYTFYNTRPEPAGAGAGAGAGGEPGPGSGAGPGGKPVRFNLERLGQYLQDQPLTILPEDDDNPWHKFLRDNPCLLHDNHNHDHDHTIYSMQEFKKYSLVQQQHYLKHAVDKVFDTSDRDVGKLFSLVYNLKCFEDRSGAPDIDGYRLSQTYDAAHQRFMTAFVYKSNGKDGISFMTVNIAEKEATAAAVKYYLSPSLIPLGDDQPTDSDPLQVLDLQFYSGEYLSVLTSHPLYSDSSVFIQLPLRIALDNANELNIRSKSSIFNSGVSRRDLAPLLEPGALRVLYNFGGCQMAVSGGRKVAVVLAKSRRKVRVYEMEGMVDDDEDDTLETTPQTPHSHHTGQRSRDNSYIDAANESTET